MILASTASRFGRVAPALHNRFIASSADSVGSGLARKRSFQLHVIRILMNAGPVILCIFRISVHNVAVNIVAPGALRIHEPDDLRFGAGLVIIVDDIGNRAFTSVRSKETPVIYNVISKIMGVAGCAVKGRGCGWSCGRSGYDESWCSFRPIFPVAVSAFDMPANMHGVCYDRPLYGDIFVAVRAEHFVDGPAERGVVDDNIFLVPPAKRVCFRFIHIAQPESHITDDQVVSIKGR